MRSEIKNIQAWWGEGAESALAVSLPSRREQTVGEVVKKGLRN